MNSYRNFLLLAAVYICGALSGTPVADKHFFSSKAPMSVGASTGTTNPYTEDLGWLDLAKQSVVLVEAPTWHGSGVCFRREGPLVDILTARHVVEDDAHVSVEELTIHRVVDGSDMAFPGTLLKKSEFFDLAIIRVNDPFLHLPIRDLGEEPPAGSLVICMGYPNNITPPMVSIGFMKGWIKLDGLYLFHTAPVWFGNSGGPAFDVRGRIIGINVRLHSIDGEHPESDLVGAVPLEHIHMFLGD